VHVPARLEDGHTNLNAEDNEIPLVGGLGQGVEVLGPDACDSHGCSVREMLKSNGYDAVGLLQN
jgi:hypothetical protein